MISDDLAKQLHDKVTKGESLSTKEQAKLEKWYTFQDSAENNVLGLTAAEKKISTLQSQVNSALSQLMTVTKHIQEIASENESLRREVSVLRGQLARLPTSQPT